jgi:hypothetical protein
MWKFRNRACFEKTLIRSSTAIIYYVCFFLKYWAGLQNNVDKEDLLRGAEALQEIALSAHRAAYSVNTLRIEGHEVSADGEDDEVA